jgi:hypothetical protein
MNAAKKAANKMAVDVEVFLVVKIIQLRQFSHQPAFSPMRSAVYLSNIKTLSPHTSQKKHGVSITTIS